MKFYPSINKKCHIECTIWQAKIQALSGGKKKLSEFFQFSGYTSDQIVTLKVKTVKVVFLSSPPTEVPSSYVQHLVLSPVSITKRMAVTKYGQGLWKDQNTELSQNDKNTTCRRKEEKY